MRFVKIRSVMGAKLPPIPWMRFARELLTIVLGVFLALIGQEWLNSRFERSQTQFAEAELRHEIMISAQNAYQRLALVGCLNQELTAIAAQLTHNDDHWEPVKRNFAGELQGRALYPVYGTPTKPWNSAAWQTAIASNSLTFMPVERVVAYVHVYEAIEKIRDLQDAEFDAGARLSVLSIAQPMTQQFRSETLMAVGQADANLAMITNVSAALLHETAQLDYVLSDEERAGFEQRIRGAKEVRGACVRRPPLDL